MPNKLNLSKPPRYIAGYKDGELIGLRTTKEWAAATGIPMGTIADAAREGRQTRAGYTFKVATEEQILDRQYLRQGMGLKQMAKAAKANNMSYGQLQAELIAAEHPIEAPPHWKRMPEEDKQKRGISKDQFVAYLRARGYKAVNDGGCVKMLVPEINRRNMQIMKDLIAQTGYVGSYGLDAREQQKTEELNV